LTRALRGGTWAVRLPATRLGSPSDATGEASAAALAASATRDPERTEMDVRFLRDEAARFRQMAGTADREATKLRLLAMAADYAARAGTAGEPADPHSGTTDNELAGPAQDGQPAIIPGGKAATKSKDSLVRRSRPAAGTRSGQGI